MAPNAIVAIIEPTYDELILFGLAHRRLPPPDPTSPARARVEEDVDTASSASSGIESAVESLQSTRRSH